MSNKYEVIGSTDGLSAFIPGPDHYAVRSDDGTVREVYVGSNQTVGEAIAKGQFTDRDMSDME